MQVISNSNILTILKSREFAVAVLAFLTVLLEPVFNMSIPTDSMELFFGSLALILFSYISERGARSLLNQTLEASEVWWDSKRLGMTVLALFAVVLEPTVGVDVTAFSTNLLIGLFGIVGVFGYTLDDLGQIFNPVDDSGSKELIVEGELNLSEDELQALRKMIGSKQEISVETPKTFA